MRSLSSLYGQSNNKMTRNQRMPLSSFPIFIVLLAVSSIAGCTGLTSAGIPKGTNTSSTAISIASQPASQTVNVGQSATFQVAAAGNGTLTYSWKKNGTAVSGATAASYTTPAATSSDNGAQFAAIVADGAGTVTSNAATLTVNVVAGPLTLTLNSLPQASTNRAYLVVLTAAGGTPGYSWSIVSGQLPAGLSLMAATGEIVGTPTAAGQSSLTVKVNDSAANPASATQALTLAVVTGVALDQYGGRTDIACTATGWFHTQKIGNRWWLCTPLGNVFYAQMMNGVTNNVDSTLQATIARKYSTTAAWAVAANTKLQNWNFNSLTTNSNLENLAIGTDNNFPVDSQGIHSQPVKMPFTMEVRPAYYSMRNPVMGSTPFLTNPTKNMIFVHSPYYRGYVAPGGVADYYDSGITTWLHDDLTSGKDYAWTSFNASPYQNYIIGIMLDDGDEMNGFGAGPDFATIPAGHNNFTLGMQVAAMSPLETANSALGFIYTDTLIHSKMSLRNALATEYVTIAGLNSAWGSNYTTFDSSGVCVGSQPITCATNASADSVGTGNGIMLTFSKTLSHTTISGFSLQILVAGVPVAGDLCNNWSGTLCSANAGTLYGPNVSTGTINYSAGALNITFKPGHAPASNAAITATYVANGWGIGTGFLDEDDSTSHNWMGTDWNAMSNANAATAADFAVFYQAIAAIYFSDCQTELHAVYPNILDLGPDSLGGWNAPSAAPVLKAAAQYTDAFVTGSSVIFSQAEMDFIAANYGDKPYFGSFYSAANPDSALSTGTNPTVGGYSTQAARGSAYSTMATEQLQTAHTTAGNYPYIGMYWWEYYDNWGEQLNWGLVTHFDNAYDGHEPVTGRVACSAPLSAYTCGGESVPASGGGTPPFGDLITSVKAANMLWLNIQ